MKGYIFEIEEHESDYAEVFFGWIRKHSPELIRCKDCKYWMQNPFREYPREVGLCFKHKDFALATDETDFCSWAERRTDETD